MTPTCESATVPDIFLESVKIDVNFSDENGNSVPASFDPENKDAKFYISIDSMENIDTIDGTGTVNPASSADIHWLIIPATGASNGLENGTPYHVGATLTYFINGEEHTTIREENAWLSKTRDENKEWQYFVNLFDTDTTGSYTITFDAQPSGAQPPVLRSIPDQSETEGEQVSFIIKASDPNGTIPIFSTSPCRRRKIH